MAELQHMIEGLRSNAAAAQHTDGSDEVVSLNSRGYNYPTSPAPLESDPRDPQ
jgi:hypothetical protein